MQQSRTTNPLARSALLLGFIGAFLGSSSQTAKAEITNPVIGNIGKTSFVAESGGTFAYLFVHFWNVVIVVGGIVVLLNFIMAAVEWITAGGDSSKITKARDKIIQSIVGLAILVFSFVLINFIGDLLFGSEFTLLQFTIPTPGSPPTP